MTFFRKAAATALAATTMLAMPSAAVANTLPGVSDFFVFGDSLSDPGNLFNDFLAGDLTLPFFVDPNGQVSDGDTWASQLGADFASGTNYSYASARAADNGIINFDADTGTTPVDVPDLSAQIAAFSADVFSGAATTGPTSVAAVMIGGNALRDAFGDLPNAQAIAEAAILNTVTAVGTLLASGVGQVIVSGVPNLGLIPEVLNSGDVGTVITATNISALYNQQLQAALNQTFGRGTVGYFDLFGVLGNVTGNPTAFGFNQPLNETCLDAITGLTALNCAGFLFFDSIHPTTAGHAIIADAFARKVAAVPLPAGVVLLLGALGGLAVMRRRA